MQVRSTDTRSRDPDDSVSRVQDLWHGFMVDADPQRPPVIHGEHGSDAFVFGFYRFLRRRANIDYAPTPQSSTHVLAISGQHIALSAAMTFVVQRLSAVPMLFRKAGLGGARVALHLRLGWGPPLAIHTGVVTTFVLVASSLDTRSHPYTVRTDNTPKVRFSATVEGRWLARAVDLTLDLARRRALRP